MAARKETKMKVLIINFSFFNGINMMYATHYYVDGKRVAESRFRHPSSDRYEWLGTRQWSDHNKNGVRRDYTEIRYREKEKKNLTFGW